MGDDIHSMGGLRKDEIELMGERLLREVQRMIDASEAKTRAYVDQRDEHKQNNLMQAIVNTTALWTRDLKHLEDMGKNQHRENSEKLETLQTSVTTHQDESSKKLDAINYKIGIAIGAVAVAQIVLSHVWK